MGKYDSENLKGIGSLKVEGRRNNTKTIYGLPACRQSCLMSHGPRLIAIVDWSRDEL